MQKIRRRRGRKDKQFVKWQRIGIRQRVFSIESDMRKLSNVRCRWDK